MRGHDVNSHLTECNRFDVSPTSDAPFPNKVVHNFPLKCSAKKGSLIKIAFLPTENYF